MPTSAQKKWTPLIPLAEIPEGSRKISKGVLLFHENQSIYATELRCPHMGLSHEKRNHPRGSFDLRLAQMGI